MLRVKISKAKILLPLFLPETIFVNIVSNHLLPSIELFQYYTRKDFINFNKFHKNRDRCCLVNHVIIGCVLNHANFSTTHPPMIAPRAMIFARLMVSLK